MYDSSAGWEFFPIIEVKTNIEIKTYNYWSFRNEKIECIIEELIKAGVVEEV